MIATLFERHDNRGRPPATTAVVVPRCLARGSCSNQIRGPVRYGLRPGRDRLRAVVVNVEMAHFRFPVDDVRRGEVVLQQRRDAAVTDCDAAHDHTWA